MLNFLQKGLTMIKLFIKSIRYFLHGFALIGFAFVLYYRIGNNASSDLLSILVHVFALVVLAIIATPLLQNEEDRYKIFLFFFLIFGSIIEFFLIFNEIHITNYVYYAFLLFLFSMFIEIKFLKKNEKIFEYS
jgi:hypothetical protein